MNCTSSSGGCTYYVLFIVQCRIIVALYYLEHPALSGVFSIKVKLLNLEFLKQTETVSGVLVSSPIK